MPIRSPLLALLAGLYLPAPSLAEPARYPLTLQNCGRPVTFAKPPGRVVSLGQSVTEILFRLGLADRVVGTAVWLGPVAAGYEAANARIRRLADNDPSFEAVVGQEPDLVAAQFEWHVGARGSVGTRDQFAGLGIPTYIAPADCVGKDNATGGDGTRSQLFSMELIHQQIREFAAVFDVPGRGDALIAELRQREADAVASVAGRGGEVPVVFWFSSRDIKGDPFVAGRTGVPSYILSKLGARNVITTDDEWPTVSWEAIAAANPAVIVIARMDRRRFPADDVALKLKFLETDPVLSQLDAVKNKRFIVLDAQSMNPTMRTIDGIEAVAAGMRTFGLAR